eukprot:ANDGO_07924.mRNA.1 hypothetical protein GUITHDRAFT_150776
MSAEIVDRYVGCVLGALIGDALGMPVHWFYDTTSLRTVVERKFPSHRSSSSARNCVFPENLVRSFTFFDPQNPHPNSILARSVYRGRIDILHDQKRFWGPGGHNIHYHQFLRAGENTLNLQLSRLLVLSIVENRGLYNPDDYLARYIDYLTVPNRHRDTYLEEYHRGFFVNYAQNEDPKRCGLDDVHIGGLSHVAVMTVWAHSHGLSLADGKQRVREHVQYTHTDNSVLHAVSVTVEILYGIFDAYPGVRSGDGSEVLERAHTHNSSSSSSISSGSNSSSDKVLTNAISLAWPSFRTEIQPNSENVNDFTIVGRLYSPACYILDSFPAVLTLATKYAADPEAGLVANTMVGGDNCHRGAVLGALFGAAHGLSGLPQRWTSGLADSQAMQDAVLQMVGHRRQVVGR